MPLHRHMLYKHAYMRYKAVIVCSFLAALIFLHKIERKKLSQHPSILPRHSQHTSYHRNVHALEGTIYHSSTNKTLSAKYIVVLGNFLCDSASSFYVTKSRLYVCIGGGVSSSLGPADRFWLNFTQILRRYRVPCMRNKSPPSNFTLFEPSIVIHTCKKSQRNAHFFH